MIKSSTYLLKKEFLKNYLNLITL